MQRLAVLAVLATFLAARAEAAIIQFSALSPDGSRLLGPPLVDLASTPELEQNFVYWSTQYSGTVEVGFAKSLAELFADQAAGNLVTLTSPGLVPLSDGPNHIRSKFFDREMGRFSINSNVLATLERFEVTATGDRLRIHLDSSGSAGAVNQPDPPLTVVNPEPSSIVLFTVGGALLALGVRRRRKG